MFQFKVTLHRYRNGEGRFSNAQFLAADDFDQALRIANAIITGLVGGDPASKYTVNSIEVAGQRGIECNGVGMFETLDEVEARLGDGKAVQS